MFPLYQRSPYIFIMFFFNYKEYFFKCSILKTIMNKDGCITIHIFGYLFAWVILH